MTANNNDPDLAYQRQTKMFYYIAITTLHAMAIVRNEPVTKFALRMTSMYNVLCRATGSWREDEQYKADPRWNKF